MVLRDGLRVCAQDRVLLIFPTRTGPLHFLSHTLAKTIHGVYILPQPFTQMATSSLLPWLEAFLYSLCSARETEPLPNISPNTVLWS